MLSITAGARCRRTPKSSQIHGRTGLPVPDSNVFTSVCSLKYSSTAGAKPACTTHSSRTLQGNRAAAKQAGEAQRLTCAVQQEIQVLGAARLRGHEVLRTEADTGPSRASTELMGTMTASSLHVPPLRTIPGVPMAVPPRECLGTASSTAGPPPPPCSPSWWHDPAASIKWACALPLDAGEAQTGTN